MVSHKTSESFEKSKSEMILLLHNNGLAYILRYESEQKDYEWSVFPGLYKQIWKSRYGVWEGGLNLNVTSFGRTGNKTEESRQVNHYFQQVFTFNWTN